MDIELSRGAVSMRRAMPICALALATACHLSASATEPDSDGDGIVDSIDGRTLLWTGAADSDLFNEANWLDDGAAPDADIVVPDAVIGRSIVCTGSHAIDVPQATRVLLGDGNSFEVTDCEVGGQNDTSYHPLGLFLGGSASITLRGDARFTLGWAWEIGWTLHDNAALVARNANFRLGRGVLGGSSSVNFVGDNTSYSLPSISRANALSEGLEAQMQVDGEPAILGENLVLVEDSSSALYRPDFDGDGFGGADDAFPRDAGEWRDSDDDGVGDNSDAFPDDPAESVDTDGDGVGNNADTDDDGDLVDDADDAFPLDRSESVDTDGDGIGNNADADDDGDGMSDAFEAQYGFDPLDRFDAYRDADGDAVPNYDEIVDGTDPTNPQDVEMPLAMAFGTAGVAEYAFDLALTDGVDLDHLASQPDGKVIATGSIYPDADEPVVMRLHEDGSLDTAFATDGYFAPLDFASDRNGDRSAVLADGSVLVSTRHPAGLLELTAEGELDTTFFADESRPGFWTIPDAARSAAPRLLPMADGSTWVTYTRSAVLGSARIARLDANGVLDPTFATNGEFDSGVDLSYVVSLQSLGDGAVLAAVQASSQLHLFKLAADGQPVAGFGTDGVVVLGEGISVIRQEATALADGGFAVQLSGVLDGRHGLHVVRFRADGSRATDFADMGVFFLPADSRTKVFHPLGLFEQADGTLVVAATEAVRSGVGRLFLAARLLADGQPDARFGTDGIVRVRTGAFMYGATMLPNHDIVFGGSRRIDSGDYLFSFAAIANESDRDRDGVEDHADAFPDSALETLDSDGDGVGDNADAFPLDNTESVDSDGDGVGDNADAFPLDGSESVDSDGDGVGDVADDYPLDPRRHRHVDDEFCFVIPLEGGRALPLCL